MIRSIKKDLEEIGKILIELEDLKTSIVELTNEKEEYFDLVVKKSHFYYKVYVNYVKLFVIDAYKLMGEKEAYNLKKLLNNCIDSVDRSIPNKEQIINQYRSILKEFENIHSRYFEMINVQRNKFYAHTDRNKENYEFSRPTKELFEILSIFQKIYSVINKHCNERILFFTVLDNRPNEILNSYRYFKIRKLYIEGLKSSKKEIDISEIGDIINN